MPSPLISVVLSAYDQQQQLKDCLDSLLSQSSRDFEVVLVVDRSPDSPERLTEAYEMRDPRVSVLRLDAAVGIGRSRNAGAAHAKGEYLLFLDSDHVVEPEAIKAMAGRLAETGEVDVLLFGHSREYRDRVWPGGAAELLSSAGPEVFSPLDRPEVFGAPPLIWDRLVRRDSGLPAFPDGHYEEIPVVHEVLLAAKRIAVLDQECVRIRRRHTLHPTGSPGSSHFDIFEQYGRSLELLGEHEEFAAAKPFLFTRMIRNFLFVFDLAGCVPRAERPQFFHRASEYYRSHLPADYRRPGGREGVKFSLLSSGAYAAFEVAKLSQIARNAVGRS
ncbi:glycosyltransferase family A protein [Kitasatospora sp. GP82]|uniref:glycosyltransferase family 2 protein n=1 Tax=Kitasatospora sp. GP82 TaxID=3035089 RepID=UPI0024748753|nr:glycosyltransferase family A protein [Kitasatospora sp. GP82]MDH6125400.1 glycosyltransferase involved in cell wall biosynthesis [Kitasatospora sp. GP82]